MDEIWIATAPKVTRVLFLVAGTVVEIWHEFTAAPNRIGEVHRLKIDQVFVDQNRATARLPDGTPVSLRIRTSDQLLAGHHTTVTIIAAPRQGKPWQAIVGARLVGTHVVLLPGDNGFRVSRALPDHLAEPMRCSLADKLPTGFGAILRRAAVGQETSVVQDELMMLLNLWQGGLQSTGCIHDGGSLFQKAALHAPGATTRFLGEELPTDRFEATYGATLDVVKSTRVDLATGGRLWFEPTNALTAIDLDSGAGGFEALLREAPTVIAYQLRLRGLSGLIAIDVPRLPLGAAKTFTAALAAALSFDPRQPEILGRTRGGVLECRIAHGRPSLDSQTHLAKLEIEKVGAGDRNNDATHEEKSA